MAKQKSGLGRGLNALFDDSSLSSQINHSHAEKEEKKVEETPKNEKVETPSQTTQVSSQKESATPEPKVKKQAAQASSNIYFSEDDLENAKVVSREARPKPANQEPSRFEHRKGAFQYKSAQAAAQGNRNQASGEHATANYASKPSAPARPATSFNQKEQAHHSAEVIRKKIENISASAKPEEKKKEEKGDTGVVPLDKVQPNPDQPRTNFKPEEIDELASSIKKEGLLQPILVRKVGDHYQIIAGERRWQACKKLNMKEIPVRFWAADNDKALELALIENIQRTDLNPIEEAYGYKRLMERRGMTQSEVAQTVSKGRSTIANALRLLDLPEEAQQLLFEEKITAGHARAILSIPDAEGRKTLTNKLMNEKLSVRETEAIARLLSGRVQAKEGGAKKRVPMPASFKKAARGLTRFLSVPVKVKTVQGKNKIEIQFKDEEELQRILNLIAEHGESNKEEAAQ